LMIEDLQLLQSVAFAFHIKITYIIR
jgi:hypothetical protein